MKQLTHTNGVLRSAENSEEPTSGLDGRFALLKVWGNKAKHVRL